MAGAAGIVRGGLLLVFLLVGCSSPWTRGDTYRQAAVTAAITADWYQTRDIAGHPQKWEETNPILGKHPSKEKVDVYFLSTILGNAAIAAALPRGWREGWQFISLGFEGGYVVRNYKLGVGK